MKFKGAVFDLDGTLLDSMEVWKNIDIEFFQSVDWKFQKATVMKYWP